MANRRLVDPAWLARQVAAGKSLAEIARLAGCKTSSAVSKALKRRGLSPARPKSDPRRLRQR